MSTFFRFTASNDHQNLEDKVASLATNSELKRQLNDHSLNISTVAWEDTSRFMNSSYGSNISDLTLKTNSKRMPIIRSNNFTDTTVDLSSHKLPKLVVGNQNGTSLMKVTLDEYLKNFHEYCGTIIPRTDLYNDRDQHVLTSAQACILPISNSKVEFAVDLYNYQSGSEPAVLVIIATAYGTSAQVVTGGNTVLYFNDEGTNRLFKAERLRDYRQAQGKALDGAMDSEEKALNGIYIFQVPLKVKEPGINFFEGGPKWTFNSYEENCFIPTIYSVDSIKPIESNTCKLMSVNSTHCVRESSNSRGMDRAILSLGQEKGIYKGVKKSSGGTYELIRDAEKPIRLTVQFYMCTDSVKITDETIMEINQQIRHIYEQGHNEGSLVIDDKSKIRPTASKDSNLPHLIEDISIL
ncbi:hypothetical protein QLL95_gp0724 [Cotonvirus japonicus]|uniref:Uncharacterized protein n=1 Tax=Cotonvirus japonicus TaxID=2811091 RepID=A0ABM7NTE4_9VIRU|nr:hypothetical protein QLL95_gp0724 [Cotonvirus japonicus]BCS83399.1 hypothetical protein [Cotonvirus japonicus]